MWEQGIVTSAVMKGKEAAEEEKFADLLRLFRTYPHHPLASRARAVPRPQPGGAHARSGPGEALEAAVPHPCVAMIAAHFGIEDRNRPADPWLADVCRWTGASRRRCISARAAGAVARGAETEAIRIFGRNLHELLLAAPPAPRPCSASTPAYAPAARWRWSMPPASFWRRPPSTRTSRAMTGRARWRRWHGWWCSMGSS